MLLLRAHGPYGAHLRVPYAEERHGIGLSVGLKQPELFGKADVLLVSRKLVVYVNGLRQNVRILFQSCLHLLLHAAAEDIQVLLLKAEPAGSGVSIMIFSPVVSALVLRYSLQTTFLLQAGFMLISAACVFLLLRDDPAQKGLSPYGEGGVSSVKAREQEGPAQLPALVMWMLALMMLLIGGAGQAFSGHLSVLARSCGYTVRAAATVVSLQGMVLVCSKLLSGGVADRFGPRRCTTLLIAIFLLGCAAVQFMNGVSLFWCFVPPCLMGFGASVYNVGPPLWAGDLSDKAGYPKLLKWLQIFYNLGGILFSAVPGIIADHTGEYKSSYLLIAAMMLLSLTILRWAYWRGLKKA